VAVWHRDCSEVCVLPLVFLGLGLLCALISRILLVIAAAKISGWWVFGVWLPFGPLLFRLNYPEEARPSMMFRLATLPCIFIYLLIGYGPTTLSYYKRKSPRTFPPRSSQQMAYAMEKTAPSLDERRLVNSIELERLRKAGEELRLRKRDLLHSDVEGNREYVVDLALYNQALAKATAEKSALAK
jgi:hypothetical protein